MWDAQCSCSASACFVTFSVAAEFQAIDGCLSWGIECGSSEIASVAL